MELPNINELLTQTLDRSLELLQEKKLPEAEILLKQLLKVDPKNVRGLQLLGLLNHQQGQYGEAIKLFTEALKYDPDNAENHNNISLAYACMGFVDKAIQHANKAIYLSPDNHFYYSNLGLHYRQKGAIQDAVNCFEKSIDLNPNYFYAWSNMGSINGVLKDLDRAEACFRKAIELNPEHHPAYVDLAHVMFLRGEYFDAWPFYEHRLECFPPALRFNKVYDPSRRWHGGSLKGKTIAVYCEQGIGDFLQFVRYIKLLNEEGARVLLHTPKALIPLIRYNVDAEIKEVFRPEEYDCHCSMVSLPHLFHILRVDVPYLKVEKQVQFDQPEFKIGIAWAGNPQHPSDRVRSCRLEHFRQINDLPGVKLFNLQKETGPRQYVGANKPVDLTANCEGMNIINLSEYIENFEDTAAFIQQMDLIISVDTAILHLAGALGKPTWALLPFNPDWRWRLEGSDTIWYPSMRLFRQTAMNDWPSIFEQVHAHLLSHLNSRASEAQSTGNHQGIVS